MKYNKKILIKILFFSFLVTVSLVFASCNDLWLYFSYPTNLVASDGDHASYIFLSWSEVNISEDESEDGSDENIEVDHYNIYRTEIQEGIGSKIGEAYSGSYQDYSVENATLYYYTVTVVFSNALESAESNEDSGFRMDAEDLLIGDYEDKYSNSGFIPISGEPQWFRFIAQKTWNYSFKLTTQAGYPTAEYRITLYRHPYITVVQTYIESGSPGADVYLYWTCDSSTKYYLKIEPVSSPSMGFDITTWFDF